LSVEVLSVYITGGYVMRGLNINGNSGLFSPVFCSGMSSLW